MITQKAVLAVMTLGNLELDVFQMPDESYRFSMTQAAELIGKTHNSIVDFLEGKSPQALPHKGFQLSKFKVDGDSKPKTSITLSLFTSYITYWARKGNEQAWAILEASLAETLERRADAAFDIKRTEEEYNAKYIARVDGIQARINFTDTVQNWFDSRPAKIKQALCVKSPCFDHFTMAVYENCGLKQTYLNFKKVYGDTANFRDELDAPALKKLDNFEYSVSAAMMSHGIDPLSAVERVSKAIH